MITLNNKKEFIYALDNKYYIIGGCECKECDDNKLIQLYQDFIRLTSNDEFKNHEVQDIQKSYRNNVVNVYKKLLLQCYVPIEKNAMTGEKRILRQKLVSEYNAELERQFEVWVKADTCLFHKEIDDLIKKT